MFNAVRPLTRTIQYLNRTSARYSTSTLSMTYRPILSDVVSGTFIEILTYATSADARCTPPPPSSVTRSASPERMKEWTGKKVMIQKSLYKELKSKAPIALKKSNKTPFEKMSHWSLAQGISSPLSFPSSSKSSRSKTDRLLSFHMRSCTQANPKSINQASGIRKSKKKSQKKTLVTSYLRSSRGSQQGERYITFTGRNKGQRQTLKDEYLRMWHSVTQAEFHLRNNTCT